MDPAARTELEGMALQKPMNEALARGDSEIQKFYRGSTVFVTGATGFLGKLLVEKLVRICDVNKVYVLIRGKNGKSPSERLDSMLSDPVFDRLKGKMPDFATRIYPVEGDTMFIKLAIADEDRATLTDEVEIIFHMAAIVKFEDTLKKSTIVNVRGTREMMCLAKDCKKLKLFAHVSTAYVSATRDNIGREVYEQFYPTPLPPDTMIHLAETLAEDKLLNITPHLIDGWPNTYTFTKALAEEVVRTYSGDLPVCIVRPPIVLSTYYDPVPGWTDMSCVYGGSAIVLGAGIGIIRVMHANPNMKLCYMPADYVNNLVLIAAWDRAVYRSINNREPVIYTISSTACGITFGTIAAAIRNDLRKYPTPKMLWYGFICDTKSKYLYMILVWLLHFIPGYIIDGVCYTLRIQRPKGVPSLTKVYTKVSNMSNAFSYFLFNEWFFRDDNLQKAYSRMTVDDRAIYNVDVATIDWKRFVILWGIGLRKYVLKDGLKNTRQARRKQSWLKLLNIIVLTVYFYVLYKIVFYMFYLPFLIVF